MPLQKPVTVLYMALFHVSAIHKTFNVIEHFSLHENNDDYMHNSKQFKAKGKKLPLRYLKGFFSYEIHHHA